MDEKVEKAFAVANYMATLSTQRRIILEEYNQKLIYYVAGATFKITPELINFIKTTVDLGHVEDVAFIDANNFPVIIEDVNKFFNDVVSIYYQALNEYAVKFSQIKTKRKITDIVEL